jgi:Phospholipase_D-nuclease N-terminal
LENSLSISGAVLAALVPLVVIEVGLWIWALVDLVRRDRVRGGSKLLWAVVILLLEVVGPIVYLAWGRNAEPPQDPGRGDVTDPWERGRR